MQSYSPASSTYIDHSSPTPSSPRRSAESVRTLPRQIGARRERTAQDRSRSMSATSTQARSILGELKQGSRPLPPFSTGTNGEQHSPSPHASQSRRTPIVYPALLSRVAQVFRERITLGDRVKDGLTYKDAFDGREACQLHTLSKRPIVIWLCFWGEHWMRRNSSTTLRTIIDCETAHMSCISSVLLCRRLTPAGTSRPYMVRPTVGYVLGLRVAPRRPMEAYLLPMTHRLMTRQDHRFLSQMRAQCLLTKRRCLLVSSLSLPIVILRLVRAISYAIVSHARGG